MTHLANCRFHLPPLFKNFFSRDAWANCKSTIPSSFTAHVTLWTAHRAEAIESYCKEYNAKYADVTKEAGLVLVETVNLLMGLQASDVHRYSLEPFVVTRNCFGTDPTVAVIQLDADFKVNDYFTIKTYIHI